MVELMVIYDNQVFFLYNLSTCCFFWKRYEFLCGDEGRVEKKVFSLRGLCDKEMEIFSGFLKFVFRVQKKSLGWRQKLGSYLYIDSN